MTDDLEKAFPELDPCPICDSIYVSFTVPTNKSRLVSVQCDLPCCRFGVSLQGPVSKAIMIWNHLSVSEGWDATDMPAEEEHEKDEKEDNDTEPEEDAE